MEENGNLLDSLLGGAIDYSKTSFELIRLKAIDKVSWLVSSAFSRFLAILITSMSLLMGSFALAFWIGDALGKPWYGFLVVAAFYGLLAIVLFFLMHKWIKKQVGNYMVRKLLK